MNRISVYFALHGRAAWAVVISVSLLVAFIAGWADVRAREELVVSQLQTEARRSSIEIMSTTLNGNLMGSITLLGLIDPHIKQEALGGLMSQDSDILGTLSAVGGSFGAEGVFVVGEDGIVKTSWDRMNKPSTGLNVTFRPYYKMALQGKTSVYAAISMARGDRALYFTAPVFAERAKSHTGIGGVVARTDLRHVDAVLKDRFDQAMLLSPQGIVFASSSSKWLGMIDGVPDVQRLAAIRALKQFGKMFDEQEPLPLPMVARNGAQTVSGERFAVGVADVDWNDPSGPWKLVLMSNLSRTVPWSQSALVASGGAILSLLLGWMWIHLLQGRHAQRLANERLQAFAEQQQAHAAYRTRLAGISVQLQRCGSAAELAQVFLREARDLLGAVQGVLYVADSDAPQTLRLAGFSACSEKPAETLCFGEGLLGQCALERRTRLIDRPAPGVARIRSALGSSEAASLVLTPLLVQDSVVGVMELALLKVGDELPRDQLDELVSLLANSVDVLLRNVRLQQLSSQAATSTGTQP